MSGSNKSQKWKVGAKEALLMWCKNHITANFGIQVNDFGRSWRDGRAFLAVINCIKSGSVNINNSAWKSNKERLEGAFATAESELGIARLLDPEDVDVETPDERSIMTYVAQFLHRYADNISEKTLDSSESFEVQFNDLEAWLSKEIKWFEEQHLSKGAALKDYARYQTFKEETSAKQSSYDKLCNHLRISQTFRGKETAWTSIETKWQKVKAQVRHWQWLLDTALPGELGQVGEWLNRGEALIYADDMPTELNEEAAAVLSQKIDDHKAFFADWNSVKEQASRIASSNDKAVRDVPPDQINSLMHRLTNIGPKGEVRAVRLKYLEHKCCIVAFLQLTESKLKNWDGQVRKRATRSAVSQPIQSVRVEKQDLSGIQQGVC